MSDFSYKIKSLPEKSGVYIMKNKDGEVIYVGKAKILKNRVKQYFTSKKHTPKVAAMVENVADFEYIMTDNELEALILECNLIKKYMPKYNILLKDDKTYPFIKISVNEMYPRITVTRNVKNDGAKYFGPYLSSSVIRELTELIREIFGLRSCNKKFPDDFNKSRPCLYYHIGKCSGVCMGNVDENEYRKKIDKVCSFLNGNTEQLLNELEQKMYESSKNLNFERAAFFRDRIENVKSVSQKQKAVNTNNITIDAIATENLNSTVCIQVFFIRNGKMLGRENYFVENTNDDAKTIITDFIKQYYSNASFVPGEILTECTPYDSELLAQWLTSVKGRKVTIRVPVRGENLKLINMIKLNAKKELSNRELKILRDIKFKNTALLSLKNSLGLNDIPRRIEAYDISGFAGEDMVASMVTFVDAKPYKKDYRSFKIKTVDNTDDCASMNEVLKRRLRHLKEGELFAKKPDVIFVDGGMGQLNAAKEALSHYGFDIPVFGIKKDDNHNTYCVVGFCGEIKMDRSGEGFLLLVNIQDEMHRRAISHYRKLSENRNLQSELDKINGVGKKRRTQILKYVKNVKKASLEELLNVPGIDKKTAQNIYEYFRQNES